MKSAALVWLGLFASVTGFRAFGFTPKLAQELQIQRGCSVYSSSGKLLKVFPGRYCLFFDDGRLIYAEAKMLKMIDKHQTPIWSLPLPHIHHQINFSSDQNSILVMTSEFSVMKGKGVRSEVLLRVGLDGKIINRLSFRQSDEERDLTGLPEFKWDLDVSREYPGYIETNHFNSIHEIPENRYAARDPRFRQGNVIVNDAAMGVIIFTNDLQTILGRIPLPKVETAHDAQVLKSGEILYFANRKIDPKVNNVVGPYSEVEAYDPIRKKTRVLFRAEPRQLYFSEYCGGVQELSPSIILISHMSAGILVYDWVQKKLLHANPQIGNPRPGGIPTFTQEYRALRLSSFLKAWGVSEKDLN